MTAGDAQLRQASASVITSAVNSVEPVPAPPTNRYQFRRRSKKAMKLCHEHEHAPGPVVVTPDLSGQLDTTATTSPSTDATATSPTDASPTSDDTDVDQEIEFYNKAWNLAVDENLEQNRETRKPTRGDFTADRDNLYSHKSAETILAIPNLKGIFDREE
ncbi:hypothetical protein HDU76_003965 [Blyttiomyces sp. JEL0837]|nr:hypothetical protein HDU76_003965 [Blyttiomyces sp. JEL0837]